MAGKYWVASLVTMLFFIPFNVVPALAQTKITVGVAAMSPRTIPLIIAQEQGLFAKQGIEARVVLIKGAPILVASLVSGELEVGYTGGTSVVGAAAQGSYLKIDSAEKPLRFFSFLWALADEPEFVAGIDFPLYHLPWFDIDGRS